jgi:hypothetical protein
MEDLALLQCLIEVDELFRPGTRGTHQGKVVLLGSLGLDALGNTFHAHPLNGALESRLSILPHDDGAFPAI